MVQAGIFGTSSLEDCCLQAYEPKTIAVDGVALRAPESAAWPISHGPSSCDGFGQGRRLLSEALLGRSELDKVLLELGFEPEMIEAFAMPGFSSLWVAWPRLLSLAPHPTRQAALVGPTPSAFLRGSNKAMLM